MKKEIIITIVTIFIIIAGDLITQNYTKRCVEKTSNDLTNLKQNVLNNSGNNLKDTSKEIYNIWKENSKGLAFYIEHDELEKVDIQMKVVTADLESETPEESVSEIEQAIYLLHHIEEKRALKLKNIF
ncbi:MAG: DUF4363 family protein [Clostridia bacterium]|nr:DUF4363 family protein [Clostridia bacterium]